MQEKEQGLFRQKALNRISSPEQLTDYLRVTNPGVWLILTAVMLLLAGLLIWSAVGTLETTAAAAVDVREHTALVIPMDGTEIAAGMQLRVVSQEFVIVSADRDEYGRVVGYAEVSLPDGTYQGDVVTQTVKPIDFLLGSR